MERIIYEFISLYEIFSVSGLITSSILLKNVYPLVISIVILLCSIPEKVTKKLIHLPPYLNQRPVGSSDCNVINKGGDYTEKEGFPSGHTMKTWFLFIYSIMLYVKEKKNNRSLIGLVVVTSLYALLIPIARLRLNCHTLPQIIGGIIYGIIWAVLFYFFEENVLLKWNLYRSDKEKIMEYLNWN